MYLFICVYLVTFFIIIRPDKIIYRSRFHGISKVVFILILTLLVILAPFMFIWSFVEFLMGKDE